MDNYDLDFSKLTTNDLYEIADKFKLPIKTATKSHLISLISSRYYQLSKYMKYSYIKQLGFKGLDGRTFLIKDDKNNEYAIKIFKDTKDPKAIETEAKLQIRASEFNIAPRVIEYSCHGKFLVMERMSITLYHLFRKQNDSLTDAQQKSIISLFRRLDKAKVFHGDPNPLNFMRKNGKWFAIDYGFARPIDDSCVKRYGHTPNMTYMPLGLYLKFKEVCPGVKLSYIKKFSSE